MTCEEYYKTHPSPPSNSTRDRCSVHAIEASTAIAVSILGFSTTIFGVLNLFVTGWTIKKFGVKSALFISVFWPAIRLGIQNVGVAIGHKTGILIIQSSQIITIIGGPAGYMLALNTFVTEVIEHEERTGALGRLQGAALFGTSIGYLFGGLISDWFGIQAPFMVTVGLFCISCAYVAMFLPWIPLGEDVVKRNSGGLNRFFGPLKTFAPQKWVRKDGRVGYEYGALLLGIGVFFGRILTLPLPFGC
jgi:MFS family permease